MGRYIKAADIRPNDIIKFEYGTYDNWVTVRIDEVSNSKETYYPLKLIWHYLSDEERASKEAQEAQGASKDCRAEKLGNNPAPAPSPAPRQFTSYSSLNDLVEKLN